jgi:hypothetical protein
MPTFKEPGSIGYLYEGDVKVAQVKVDAEVLLKNTVTGQEYESDDHGQADVDNPETETKQEHLSRSVFVKVAKMPAIGAESDL